MVITVVKGNRRDNVTINSFEDFTKAIRVFFPIVDPNKDYLDFAKDIAPFPVLPHLMKESCDEIAFMGKEDEFFSIRHGYQDFKWQYYHENFDDDGYVRYSTFGLKKVCNHKYTVTITLISKVANPLDYLAATVKKLWEMRRPVGDYDYSKYRAKKISILLDKDVESRVDMSLLNISFSNDRPANIVDGGRITVCGGAFDCFAQDINRYTKWQITDRKGFIHTLPEKGIWDYISSGNKSINIPSPEAYVQYLLTNKGMDPKSIDEKYHLTGIDYHDFDWIYEANLTRRFSSIIQRENASYDYAVRECNKIHDDDIRETMLRFVKYMCVEKELEEEKELEKIVTEYSINDWDEGEKINLIVYFMHIKGLTDFKTFSFSHDSYFIRNEYRSSFIEHTEDYMQMLRFAILINKKDSEKLYKNFIWPHMHDKLLTYEQVEQELYRGDVPGEFIADKQRKMAYEEEIRQIEEEKRQIEKEKKEKTKKEQERKLLYMLRTKQKTPDQIEMELNINNEYGINFAEIRKPFDEEIFKKFKNFVVSGTILPDTLTHYKNLLKTSNMDKELKLKYFEVMIKGKKMTAERIITEYGISDNSEITKEEIYAL